MSSKNADWEAILQGLEKEPDSTKQVKSSPFGGLVIYGGLVAFGAWMVMEINSVLISAWSNMEWMTPGIGYWDSFKVCAMLGAIFSLKAIVATAAMVAGNRN